MNCRDCVGYLDEFCMVEEKAFEAVRKDEGTALDRFKLQYFAGLCEQFEASDSDDDTEFYAARCEFGLFRINKKESAA